MSSAPGEPLLPQPTPPVIPDFELVHRLGRGAFGEVWLARSLTGMYRAVKVLPKNDRTQLEVDGVRHYQQHARHHPNLIEILHIGQTESHYYYVLDLADSLVTVPVFAYEAYEPRTLRSELDRRSRMGVDAALHVVGAVLSGLGHLHAQGLLHRDIKPDNIVFINGEPKLADVGLVTRARDVGRPALTPRYAPPEGVVDKSGDLYCVGKLLAEMLLGFLPAEPPPWAPPQGSPAQRRIRAVLAVAARAASADPKRRYTRADDMARDLAAAGRMRLTVSGLWSHAFLRLAAVGVLLLAGGLWVVRGALPARAHRRPTPTRATVPAGTTPFSAPHALRFVGGEGDVARAPSNDAFDFTDGFTIEMWIEPIGYRNRGRLIGRGSAGAPGWAVYRRDSRLIAVLGGMEVESPALMDFFKLNHVAVSWDPAGGTVSFYRDGALAATARGPGALPVAPAQPTLGGSGDDSIDAILAEVRLWSRPRTAAAIAAGALRTLTKEERTDPNLAAYWPLDEGEGQFASDASGHGNHLTLGAGPAEEGNDPGWTGPLPASADPVPGDR